jgi:hypothetical protein
MSTLMWDTQRVEIAIGMGDAGVDFRFLAGPTLPWSKG